MMINARSPHAREGKKPGTGESQTEAVDRRINEINAQISSLSRVPGNPSAEKMVDSLTAELRRLEEQKGKMEQEAAGGPDPPPEGKKGRAGGAAGGDNAGGREEDRMKAPLPPALSRRFTLYFAAAGLSFIVGTAVLVMFRTPQSCIGYILAGFLVYLAFALKYDCAEGKVTELAVSCVSADYVAWRGATKVVFRTADDPPAFYEFLMSGNGKRNDLRVNGVYVIYFRKDSPAQLLGYAEM